MAELLKSPQLRSLLKDRMTDDEAAANWGNAYSKRGHDQVSAGRDHRAFARNLVHEKPVLGTITLLSGIPAYNVAKKVTNASGSKPSLYMMSEAYKGMGEGILDKLL